MPPFGSVPYAGGDSRITDILLRLGDIEARRAEQQGQILGSTVAGIGQVAGDALAQHQEAKGLAARDRALVELMGKPDATPQDFARVAGPKLGLETYAAVQAFNKTAAGASREEAAKLLPIQLKAFKKLTPEARATLYPALRANSIKVGLFGEQDAPAEYTPDLDPTIDAIVSAFEGDVKTREVKVRTPEGGERVQIVEDVPGQTFESAPDPIAAANAVRAQAAFEETRRHNLATEAAARSGGAPRLVQVETVDEQGRPVTKFVTPEAGAAFAKPSGQAKQATGQQRRALGFFNRGNEANEIATALEEKGSVDPTKIKYTPELANFMLDDANQAYKQAQRTFTEARLRKESGAAVPPHEYENDAKTYFAQPGDSEATKKQKAQARREVLAGIAFESGDALREFYGEEAQGMIAGLRNPPETPQERQAVIADPNWGAKGTK